MGVLLFPPVSGVKVDEGERNLFFGTAAICADVSDDVAHDAIAHNDLVTAVLENEAVIDLDAGNSGLERERRAILLVVAALTGCRMGQERALQGDCA